MINYSEVLNESQLQAVQYTDGPSLVIAGAGSGKTRVLTYKIAYLLEEGYAPQSILALTFTNKAAREMKERIAQQVGQTARRLWMGTFHSIFARVLRTEAEALGYQSNFTIYDTADSKSLVKAIIKDMKLDDKVYKPSTVLNIISAAKNQLITAPMYLESIDCYKADRDKNMASVGQIYMRYANRCKESNAMDFDDLLLNTFLLFKNHPDVLEKYAQGFRYILVDEYQDTNYAQHRIVQQLASIHERICVVGDDAQSIYSFRGAKIDNILTFTKMYHDAKLFKLEQNYRSTQNIVLAANSLIAKNTEQIRKEVYSKQEQGDPISVINAYSDVEEAEMVCRQLTLLHKLEELSYSDFAILYRTNAQSRVFEEVFRKKSIPYRIYGGLSFYQRKEIKDVIAYFRLLVNPNDEEAFKRIVNYPARGIGDTTVQKITSAATLSHVSLWQVVCNPVNYGLSINKGTLVKLNVFRELIEQLMINAETKPAYDVCKEVVSTTGILKELYQSNDPEDMSRRENIEELLTAMQDFCQGRQEEGNSDIFLHDYLAEVALITDQDDQKDEDAPKVTLMTIHAAKGLEFNTVFIVGLEDNLFPNQMSMGSRRELEEERRLFYVALTRAEKHCFISFANTRFKFGKMEFCNPSRFLHDIDSQYISMPQAGKRIRRSTNDSRPQMAVPTNGFTRTAISDSLWDNPKPKAQIVTPPAQPRILKRVNSTLMQNKPAASPQAVNGLNVGCRIVHERFGQGIITQIEGTGDNTKATVQFTNAGEKQLLLKFARFKIID